MNVLGSVLQRVATGKHIDVSNHGDTICSLHSDDSGSCITLYQCNEKQLVKTKSFLSPNLGFDYNSIALGRNVIYVADSYEMYIYTLSMNGRLLGTHDITGHGDAGELWNPRTAATDGDDNLLVCDGANCRLQVMTPDGK